MIRALLRILTAPWRKRRCAHCGQMHSWHGRDWCDAAIEEDEEFRREAP